MLHRGARIEVPRGCLPQVHPQQAFLRLSTSDRILFVMLTKPLYARAAVFYSLVAEAETRSLSCLLKTWHGCIITA